MVDLRLAPKRGSIAPKVVIPDNTACGEFAEPIPHRDELRLGRQRVERGASMNTPCPSAPWIEARHREMGEVGPCIERPITTSSKPTEAGALVPPDRRHEGR